MRDIRKGPTDRATRPKELLAAAVSVSMVLFCPIWAAGAPGGAPKTTSPWQGNGGSISAPESAHPVAVTDSEKPREPLWTDRAVAIGTSIGAGATLVLTIATIVLAVFTYFLWRATKAAVADTEEALELSRRQFLLAGRQADLIEKQHAVERLDYFATHRPRIIVHAVEYLSVPSGDGDGRSTIGAAILCFNIGTNRARRAEARGDILATRGPAIDVQRGLIQEFEDIYGGMKLRFSIVSERSLQDLAPTGPPAICVGTIAYWDDADMRRETGFCFVLRQGTVPTWTSAGSPEHEYAY